MGKNLLLIYNPRAGKGSFLTVLSDVIDLFVKAGYTVEVYPTQGPADAVRKMEQADDRTDLVVAAGGDGTIDEIVTGAVHLGRSIPIGYIPVGSTNDFANSLGLSTNVYQETRAIIGGKPCGIDIGRLNESTFVYVAAFGTFTDVAYGTNQDMKNAFGRLAYLVEATKRLADIRSYRIKVTVNGETKTDDYAFGMALDVGKIFFGDQDVIAYSQLGIGRLIYQLPIPLCKMFIKEIFADKSPEDFDPETYDTINKFFENSLNVSETSRQLYIHRNTLVYRLDKLQKSTGLDLRVFDDAITFKIALMVVRYMKYMETLEY